MIGMRRRSVKKTRAEDIKAGPPKTVQTEVEPKNAERLHERFVAVMDKLGKEIKNLQILVIENRNTKVEIKDTSEKLTSLSICLSGETRRIWERKAIKSAAARKVVTEGVEAATQTEKTAWQVRNEKSAEHIKNGMEVRGWEGFEVLPESWPEAVSKMVRVVEGNPIWEDVEKNITLFVTRGNKLVDSKNASQFIKKYPENSDSIAK